MNGKKPVTNFGSVLNQNKPSTTSASQLAEALITGQGNKETPPEKAQETTVPTIEVSSPTTDVIEQVQNNTEVTTPKIEEKHSTSTKATKVEANYTKCFERSEVFKNDAKQNVPIYKTLINTLNEAADAEGVAAYELVNNILYHWLLENKSDVNASISKKKKKLLF